MRKTMATLLAGCLAFQLLAGSTVPVKASASIAEKTALPNVQAGKSPVSGSLKKASTNGTGSLEIEIHPSLNYAGKVTAEINGTTKELDFTPDKTAGTVRFDKVPAGERTITIEGSQFARYTQKTTIEAGWLHKILVTTSRTETAGSVHTGWLQAGDVNGDNTVNNEDKDSLLDEIRNPAGNSVSDLNNDGKTDIADLQLLIQNLDENPQESVVEQLWIPAGVTSLPGSNVTELPGNQGVTLTPANADEVISDANPVGLIYTLADGNTSGNYTPPVNGIRILSPFETDNGNFESDIKSGTVTVELDDGTTQDIQIGNEVSGNTKKASAKLYKASVISPSVTTEPDGSLILNLGTQVAVKRVTIKITGTRKNNKLAEIAKVEFVNDMDKRIPAPDLSIPSLKTPEPGNEQLAVSWTAQNNVTGYELFVEGPAGKSKEIINDTIKVTGNQYIISAIKNESLINFEKYTIKVRSVNGDWKSPWSDEVTASPVPQDKPAPPDNVKANGGYLSLDVTWKDMSDSSGYMVYYKKADETKDKYQPAVAGFVPDEKNGGTGMITTNSYKIGNLDEDTEYTVYVVGWNSLGWGSPSLESVGKPKNTKPPVLPNYKLLNTSNGEGKVSAHIVSASFGGHGGASMVSSPLDTVAKSALGVVDNDYNSYWSKTDWDDGVAYPANDRGINITLDNNYKMGFMAFAAFDEAASLETVRIDYWDSSDSSKQLTVGARLVKKLDANGSQFYIVKFDNTITANKIRLCVGRGYTRAEMKIGEIRFYNYDSLDDDIMGLYTDEMHSTLRDDVTEAVINELETLLETPDSASGEKHPLYSELKLEIDTARSILKDGPSPSYEVINQITGKKDGHLGFGGLNSWQPLGKTVYAGETLVVYVGHNTKRTGDSTNLQLVMTQYHAESNSLAKSSSALKIGRNEITVPQIADKNFERGGQLYVAYNGNNASDKYAVRVLGGSDIPVLNVYGKTGEVRTQAISNYITSLEAHVAKIQTEHERLHKGGEKAVDYDYEQTNCILNATDIMMDKMMYSLPATQILAPLSGKSDKTAALDTALQAMEDTMTLFYHHKGLSNDEAAKNNGNNALPSQHLNIRYMRMFAGAFMYASGNHIGIEYGSSALSGATGIKSFGWGIAHEIGHDINQGTYAVAEVTNNYFSQLLTGRERYTYENVYKKVTSGTIGRSSNVFTQLALYWQLHLAFDNNKDDQYVYDKYTDQFNNIFFARVDTYSRNKAKAPQEGLSLDGDADQNLMRLSCAAANANILPFFERWGMVPDTVTTAYAAKYGEPSDKAIYYVNASARDYRVDHPGETGTIKDKDVVTASAKADSNQVQVTINTTESTDLILGYEIIRSMTNNGKTESQVVGFQPVNKDSNINGGATVFTDTVSTINNRVMTYTVKAVDNFLNYSKEAPAGSVKIQTEGILDKSLWTVNTNMSSGDDTEIEAKEDDPDSGYDENNPASVEAKKLNTIERIIDNKKDASGTYNGTVPETGTAEITIDMQEIKETTSLKYFGSALSSVTIQVSTDGSTWTTVKEVAGLDGTGASGQTVWFNSVNAEERDKWIGTYDARYIKLTINHAGNISINEIDICGPSGDNIEFMQTDSGNPSIGTLKEAYQYGSKPEDVIPAGSLIFTGVYKGNPAYNVVMLYDTEGNVIGAKDGKVNAKQVIFADVPAKGNLGETSDGTWVYYVEPKQWDAETLKAIEKVRGELYRVDNATTLEGERITSDTSIITIPEKLLEITLTGKVPANN